ncbi:MAG: NAD(P)-dependent alcohol dehydrogenase [Thermoleophilia bacterium]|nr:NAD(P)-dependent alcohol dehydrogenase [Thermoleophilia bacterium]
MRAVTLDRYGPPEVLRVEEVPQPVPDEDEVLVRVHASSATRSDCGLRSAEYLVSRFVTGLFRPRTGRVGLELAGEVEEVGSAVTEYAVGDRVFGIGAGTNAEYVCVGQSGVIARIPDGMSYVEAAGVADGALSAMSLLGGRVQEGDRVLVNGASGSIGVGGVQVAKHHGAHVTAVCPTASVELMRALGADEVVDHLREDFTRTGEVYDVVFDAAGKHSFLRCRRSVAAGGIYVTTDPGFLWHDALLSLFTRRAKLGIVRYRREDVLALAEWLERGEYRPVIDRTYPLEDVAEAHRYVDTHQKVGNVVLTVR